MALRCSSTAAAAARAPAAAAAPRVQAALRRAAPTTLAGLAGLRTGSLVQRLPLRALTVAAAAQPEEPAAVAAAAAEEVRWPWARVGWLPGCASAVQRRLPGLELIQQRHGAAVGGADGCPYFAVPSCLLLELPRAAAPSRHRCSTHVTCMPLLPPPPCSSRPRSM